MTKEEASKLYLTIHRAFKELHMARYATLGESVNTDIVVAKDALERVLEDLKKIIEA